MTRRCVYKPVRGERPLWDFPDGTLAGREVSAFLVSQATGWGLVPPTILRDGPLGPGACQLWIDEPDGRRVADRLRPGVRRAAGLVRGRQGPRRGRRRVRPGARRRPAAGPAGGLRRGDQQRRPQGRPRAATPRDRPDPRRRPRRLLPRGEQAPHGALGLDGQAAAGRGGRGADRRWPGGSTARSARRSRSTSRSPRCSTCGCGCAGCCAPGRFPKPPQDWPAMPWPPI